jgi:DNA-binding NtrC family response regulator
MNNILIVDDEQRYREYLGIAAEELGYKTTLVGSGAEALRVGLATHPQVLVVDWMLDNTFDGLEIAETLSDLNPQMQTIMITGFPSVDIKTRAFEQKVFRFLSKPFDLDVFRQTLKEAVNFKSTQETDQGLAFAEINKLGEISYFNERFAKLFKITLEQHQTINDLGLRLEQIIESANDREWFKHTPQGNLWGQLSIKATAVPSGFYLFAVELDEEYWQESKTMQLISYSLIAEQSNKITAKHPRVLLIDDEEYFRRVIGSQFNSKGILCHGVPDYQSALESLRRDRGIRYVIIDFEMPDARVFNGGVKQLINDLKNINSQIEIIGMGDHSDRAKFINLGINTFLKKPWFAEDFLKLKFN